MMIKKDIFQILLKTLNYRLARRGLIKPSRPITLTFSATGICQSNCKTCYIGREFMKDPEKIRSLDLKLDEIERFFKSLGYAYFLNISGGEPYLRDDLVEIVELAMMYLNPGMIHIPTNAFLPDKIERVTREILEVIKRYNSDVPLSLKPSVDGIGDKHDEIRGLKGNFKRLEETIRRLKGVEKDYSNFYLELGTIISRYNINDIEEIEDWVNRQGVQSYRNEVAEEREEFFNIGEDITPPHEVYEELMRNFKKRIERDLKYKRNFTKITESVRLFYYDLAVDILKARKQVIPCYAGISNIHLNYDGELWPCCVLGYAHPFGNIRDFGCDYNRLYNSPKTKEVLKYIRDGKCHCPLANQAYSNIILNIPSLIRVLGLYLRYE